MKMSEKKWLDTISINRGEYLKNYSQPGKEKYLEMTKRYWRILIERGGIVTNGKAVCDIGCSITGPGIVIDDAKELIGVEPEKEFFETFGFSENYDNILGSRVEDLGGYKERFDIVFACQVLDHVEELEKALKIINEITKPGGLIIIEEKFYENWFIKKYFDIFYRIIDPLHTYRNNLEIISKNLNLKPQKIIKNDLKELRDMANFVENEKGSVLRSVLSASVWLRFLIIFISRVSGREIAERNMVIYKKV